jgi:hypothetical protein
MVFSLDSLYSQFFASATGLLYSSFISFDDFRYYTCYFYVLDASFIVMNSIHHMGFFHKIRSSSPHLFSAILPLHPFAYLVGNPYGRSYSSLNFYCGKWYGILFPPKLESLKLCLLIWLMLPVLIDPFHWILFYISFFLVPLLGLFGTILSCHWIFLLKMLLIWQISYTLFYIRSALVFHELFSSVSNFCNGCLWSTLVFKE